MVRAASEAEIGELDPFEIEDSSGIEKVNATCDVWAGRRSGGCIQRRFEQGPNAGWKAEDGCSFGARIAPRREALNAASPGVL